MIMEICRDSIHIVPESKEDEAFLEDTLGVTRSRPLTTARRVHALGLPMAWGYLAVEPVGGECVKVQIE